MTKKMMTGSLLYHRLLRQNHWPGRPAELIPRSHAKKTKNKLSVIQSKFLEENASGQKIMLTAIENGKFVWQLSNLHDQFVTPCFLFAKGILSPQVYQNSGILNVEMIISCTRARKASTSFPGGNICALFTMAASSGYNNSDVVIVAAGRTPIGNLNGCLSSLKAHELGAIVIRDVLRRGKTSASDVAEVIVGQVCTAGG